MRDANLYFKTLAGQDEIRARRLKLPPRLRTMLIMVDGAHSVASLRQAAQTLGAPEDFLDTLISMGLVAPARALPPAVVPVAAAAAAAPTPTGSTGERFSSIQKLMNDSAVDALGLRAFFYTLKLEKCFTAADLMSLLPELVKAVTRHKGEASAQALEARIRTLLG